MINFNRKKNVNFFLSGRHIKKLAKIAEIEKLNKSNIIRQLIDQQWDATRIEKQLPDIEDCP